MSPSAHISISDAYDGGNIKFLKMSIEDDGSTKISLEIKPDIYTELEKISHMQYFSFRSTLSGITDGKPQTVKYVIENASKVSYPVAWQGSTVCYSKALEGESDSWKRKMDTRYVNGELTWTHTHASNGSVYFGYFPPFSYSRHLSLVAKCAATSGADVQSLGKSLDGREIDCVSLGKGNTVCWIIHRQHPGESMAEFYAEGLLTRLLGLDSDGNVDDIVRDLLLKYTFYIVPNMCPDGSVRGHLRTNACGANLNREWCTKGDYEAPTLKRSPEVFGVLNKMDETGVDMFLDIHGDEELPFNFISGAEKVPTWGTRLESLHGAFVAEYSRINPDMQQNIGYPPPETEKDALNYLNVATNQVATRFNCLALTLEMPFKDCSSNPDPEFGWSQDACRRLGASVLGPLAYIHPHLRAETLSFPPEDAYVCPTDNFVDHEDFKPMKRMYSDHYSILQQQQ
mmetsp:Transcript_7820/g.11413  ORF Transcript_7820/g.11413 Transcript_7820/m.11413 type:complete len:456 (-) Transcript_7820:118-1485(-)|eukprot:CAMPEP_0195526494 /NCGR_PEP_ID=MMETSP0794_2-20130614/27591_1 /TAXON_ID=515487 /ORGANISM="Stephanopyxis turris, Strain CCMP 815" /LENGTH=455 /DNA_ID=CAMNT_0040657191 /DNA_START=58 /DNA_END=1425 /DNA_ORIENTATION=-